jgi:hypothetical protein
MDKDWTDNWSGPDWSKGESRDKSVLDIGTIGKQDISGYIPPGPRQSSGDWFDGILAINMAIGRIIITLITVIGLALIALLIIFAIGGLFL